MFQIRVLDPDTDFPKLSDLLNLVSDGDTTAAAQREQTKYLEGLGFFGQWVIAYPENELELIAHASLYKLSSTPYAEFTISVRPDFLQQDLNSLLLDSISNEARKQKAAYISAFASDANPSFLTFLLEHGFKTDGAFCLLEKKLSRALLAMKIDSQFVVKTYAQVQDISTLLEITNSGWADLPGHKIATLEMIQEQLEASPDDVIYLVFDAKNTVVARAGFPFQDGSGIVDSPGIAIEHRTPELYKQLVLLSLHKLQNKGCKHVQLYSWGDLDSTISAYTDLGFQVTSREARYKLDLI